VVLAQVAEVVGLQQHVAELGVRKSVLVGEPRLYAVFGHHLVDGDVLADVAQKLEHGYVAGPVGVVDEGCGIRAVLEVEQSLELPLDVGDVGSERVGVEQVALLAAARWVAHHARCSTSKHDWPVTEQLQTSQRDLPEQIADVQRVRRRVKADVGGELRRS